MRRKYKFRFRLDTIEVNPATATQLVANALTTMPLHYQRLVAAVEIAATDCTVIVDAGCLATCGVVARAFSDTLPLF